MNATAPVPFLHTADTFANEVRLIVALTQDFGTEFLPGLLWMVGLVLVTLVFTCLFTQVWAFALRACSVPMSFAQISKILLGAFLLFVGISLSFGAVGINFSGIFFSASVFAGAIIVSASSLVSDFFVGLHLHAFGVLDNHETVTVHDGTRGTLRSIGVFTTELVETNDSNKGKTQETILIPNSYMLAGPLKITWTTERSAGAGSGFTATKRRVDTRFDAERVPVPEPARTEAPARRYVLPTATTTGPSTTLTRRVAALNTFV